MKKYLLIILILGIVLVVSHLFFTRQNTFEKETSPMSAPFRSPKEWSIKLIDLFKQSIKEKYGVDVQTLDKNLIIIGVAKGNDTDGNVLNPPPKGSAFISYLYKINWAYFSGANEYALRFIAENDSGVLLSDAKIIENIKQNLNPVFSVKNIISEKDARNICKTKAGEQVSATLEPYFYNQDNHIHFDLAKDDLVLECWQTISIEKNQCTRIFLSLKTGKEIFNQQSACFVY